MIRNNHGISKEALAQKTRKSQSTVSREIKKLFDAEKIRRVGSNKAGQWEIIE